LILTYLGLTNYLANLSRLAFSDEDLAGDVRISEAHLDVPLFWQCWKLESPLVQTTTSAVGSAAASTCCHLLRRG
jgi:hypothetical protein